MVVSAYFGNSPQMRHMEHDSPSEERPERLRSKGSASSAGYRIPGSYFRSDSQLTGTLPAGPGAG